MPELSDVEFAFVLNASEIDILPGVRGDLEEPLASGSAADLAPILLSLVDRGMVEVCRYIPWTAPDRAVGYQPGPPILRADLPAVLAVAEEWEYPDDFEWLGKLTLVRTESYRPGR
ncbi:hypothetical protein GTY65_40075 [Streptomyces sp. SID8379]|uniref:hypothetical protein n=1 Tax=unclassified Streptomyces TaxID=2593676 RepID=UPI001319FBF3|nr:MULTISPECIES: hypothetical protein [unclassified Streptomyces]MYW70205.1 hypothetical protein [Streptomyces sp. SID8379]